MLKHFESIIFTPQLEKTGQNFRQVSNSHYVSEPTELSVANKFIQHFAKNYLCEQVHFSHRERHYREIPLL